MSADSALTAVEGGSARTGPVLRGVGSQVRSRECGVGSQKPWAQALAKANRTAAVRDPDSRPLTPSDQLKLPAHLPERREGLVEVCSGVCGGYLAADSCLTLGYHWIPEAGNEHALGEEVVAHADGGRGFPQDHGDDGSLPR